MNYEKEFVIEFQTLKVILKVHEFKKEITKNLTNYLCYILLVLHNITEVCRL